MAAQELEAGEADQVDARHHAGAAGGDDQVVVGLEPPESSVMLNAYMGFAPVRSAWRSSTGMTAATRSASGERAVALQLVVFDEVDTRLAELADDLGESAGDSPMLGFTIVPIIAPCGRPISRARALDAEWRARGSAPRRPAAGRDR